MKNFDLWLFFAEGGWGMYSTLLFGLIAVGGAIWFARKPEPRRLAFTAAMWLTLFTAAAHATWTNVAAVCAYLSDETRAPAGDIPRIFFMGMKEASRPGALAGIFLTLIPILLAVGAMRSRSAE